MDEEWIVLCENVYNKKVYLNKGIYSPEVEYIPRESYPDFGFVFPMPMGDVLDKEVEFKLTYDYWEYLDAIGGEEWLTNRGSDTIPSTFTYIRKSLYTINVRYFF
jgi:hypothetical protein